MTTLEGGGRVGRYRIVRFLGAGAMGEVYLAEDPHIERRLAIKTVRLAGGRPADIEDRKRRLLREARAAGRLLHPNVVTLFDTGEEEGLLYLAFEFVEGHDLASRLESGQPPTLREVLRVVRQVADALDYAHRQGIVHRDIKPSNILIDTAGHVKVADFGIAKVSGQNTELTVVGSVMGSPQYLSPEQIRGDELDGRSDIFSLGVVFYELLSGRRPFDGETITTLVYQILHKDPAINELRTVPLRIDQLLHHMLAKDRDQRIHTAALVAEELAAIERELPEEVLAAPAAPVSDVLDATRVMSSRSVSPASAGLAPAAPPPPSQQSQQSPPPFGSTAPTSPAFAAAPGLGASAPWSGTAGTPPAAAGGTFAPHDPAVHGHAYGSPGPLGQPPGVLPAAGIPPSAAAYAAAQPAAAAPGAGYPIGAVPSAAHPVPAAQPAVRAASSSNTKVWVLLGAILIFLCTALAAGAYWVWQRYLRQPDAASTTAAASPSSAPASTAAGGGGGGAAPNPAGGAVPSGSSGRPAGSAGAPTAPALQPAQPPQTSPTSPTSTSPAAASTASPSPPHPPASGPPQVPPSAPRTGPSDRGGAAAVPPRGSASSGSSTAGSSVASSSDVAAQRHGAASRPSAAAPSPASSPDVEPPPFVPESSGRGAVAHPTAPVPTVPAGPASPAGPSRTVPAPSAGADERPAPPAVPATPAADRVLNSSLELAFHVSPPDAFVLLDGGVIGKAEEWSGQKGNRAFTLPGTGSHQIKIKKSGMKDYRINVEASATRGVTPVDVTLQPLPSAPVETSDLRNIRVRTSVALRVQPDVNAMVLVDGAAAGQAKRYAGRFGHSDEWLQLPPGTHRITLVAPGYRRSDLAVDVSPGAENERQKVDITLVPDTGN